MKHHRFLGIFLTVFALATLLCIITPKAEAATVASGTCGAEGDNLTWTLDDEGTLTISGTGAMASWTSYNSVPWYSNCSFIKKVIIGNDVTSIGGYAFYGCLNLTSVNIGESVKTIGKSAFFNCVNVTSIHFNAINMNNLSSGNYVFSSVGEDTQGVEVTIGAQVTKIPAYLFYPAPYSNFLTNITSIDFEKGSVCKTIGEYAFACCVELASLTIGESVVNVDDYAFYDCGKLQEINFNAVNMKDLSDGNHIFSFAGRNAKGIKLTIGEQVIQIPAYLFCPYSENNSTPRITTVIFEGNSICKSVGKYAFAFCAYLNTISVPDSVSVIDFGAFAGCTGLKLLIIEGAALNIGADAFRSCSNLKEIVFISDAPTFGLRRFIK